MTKKAAIVGPPIVGGSVRIELGDRYNGLWIEADPEPTMGDFRRLGTEQLEPTLAVLSELITGWNVVDKRGDEVPPGEWDRVTLPLMRAILLAYIGYLTRDVTLSKN